MEKLRTISAFGWIGRALTAVSLGATLVVVSPGIAASLGAGGEDQGRTAAAWATAVGVAVILDVAWVGALTLLSRSLQARRRALGVAAAVLVTLAVAASAIALHVYGGMWLLSAPPVVGMAFLALDVWAHASLSDATTEAAIRDLEADGRNQLALMEAHVRRLRLEGELAALEETAGTGALAHQGRARALALMDAQVVRMETTATVRDGLAAAAKRTGVDIPETLPAQAVKPAGGTGGFSSAGTPGGTPGLGALATEVFGALVAAGDEVPPSKRAFRKGFRAALNDRGMAASWGTVDALYAAECDRLAVAVNESTEPAHRPVGAAKTEGTL
ncbi:hypothetical protein PV371_12630 [Streptomyces sp. TX20-6-3]|uniref:hypothetical protein n=1 Tax=Streptomyces sp. TX20-6-3 TaxID=3028705 RepID=UPI0029B8DB53|nr:hypothetical protein [Streptomyces sp. TX20-6-3]MDX2560488.1 hypothetical protein [Streptomyces sp. TX20-6-3]